MAESDVYEYLDIDAVRVREEHRIVGMLVGSLPRLPRQNVQLSLPLQLSAFETRLLVEKGQTDVASCHETFYFSMS